MRNSIILLVAIIIGLIAIINIPTSEAAGLEIPKETIEKTIDAGIKGKFNFWYKNICHPDLCSGTEGNRTHIRSFSWKEFSHRAGSYLKSTKDIDIVRRVPKRGTDEDGVVTFFLRSTKRDNPAPIKLKKDNGKWKIISLSL